MISVSRRRFSGAAIGLGAALSTKTASLVPRPLFAQSVSPVVESCGIEQTYATAPSRALALDVGPLDTMVALDLGDSLIGWFGSEAQISPKSAEFVANKPMPTLGSSWPYPTIETLLDIDPDFILAYGFNVEAGSTPQSVIDSGINFWSYPEGCPDAEGVVVDIPAVLQYISDIARIFHVEERGSSLIHEYETLLAGITETAPATQPSMLLMDFGEDAIFTAAKGALPTYMMEAAGGSNIFADDEPNAGGVWLNATFEQIVERDPEWIVVVDYDNYDERVAFAQDHPALSGTTAVQKNQFIRLTYAEVVPGVQLFAGLERMAAALVTAS